MISGLIDLFSAPSQSSTSTNQIRRPVGRPPNRRATTPQAQNQLELDDSGSDDSVPLDLTRPNPIQHNDTIGDNLLLPFPIEMSDEDEDGEEENNDEIPQVPNPQQTAPPQPPRPQADFELLNNDALGSEQYKINKEFIAPITNEEDTLKHKYGKMSEAELVIELSQPFWNVLQECSTSDTFILSNQDILLYHAFLVLRTLIPLDKIDHYWSPGFLEWKIVIKKLMETFHRGRYYEIRKNLKGYRKNEDEVPGRSRGWKVMRVVEAVRSALMKVLKHAGEFLSLDEGMGRGSNRKNPIYTSLGSLKPLEGFRFFLLCDYATKLIVNFFLDDKSLNAESCKNRPGGMPGSVIADLCSSATSLEGVWHKIMADNYYCSLPIVKYMLKQKICIAGTMKKAMTDKIVWIGGKTKKPRPSRQHPKGFLKMAKYVNSEQPVDEEIYVYSWMDSGAVFFIDPITGPGKVLPISRRKKADGTSETYRVPGLITLYNQNMHAVDVFDQIRKSFGIDLTHGTKKYTVRVFEILFSMILAQAYNIHRAIFKDDRSKLKSHTDFKLSIIEGLVKHRLVRRRERMDSFFNDHTLMQFGKGTSNRKGRHNIRKTLKCRQCPNRHPDGSENHQRATSYYCSRCNVALHPGECFDLFHANLDHSPPPKRAVDTQAINNAIGPIYW